jgi:hypothetical protein
MVRLNAHLFTWAVMTRIAMLTGRTEDVTGGRPSTGSYHLNPQIELVISRPISLQCRLHQPPALSLSFSKPIAHPFSASASRSLASPSSSSHTVQPQDSPAMNLTLFTRSPGGGPGSEQIATSGPYSDATSGVRIHKVKVDKAGVYVLVPSLFDRHAGAVHAYHGGDGDQGGEGRIGGSVLEGRGAGRRRWRVDVWADGPFEMDRVR